MKTDVIVVGKGESAEKTAWPPPGIQQPCDPLGGVEELFTLTDDDILYVREAAKGYALRIARAALLLPQDLPTGIAQAEIVSDITARDAIVEKSFAWVIDASADPTVSSGGALYIYDLANTIWYKLSEAESLDMVLSWAMLTGKPASSPAAIDSAVTNQVAHIADSHSIAMVTGLQDVLNTIGVGATWKLAVDGETITNNTGYILDGSAAPVTLNLAVPAADFTFKFMYRVVNVDNPITITLNGAKWEGLVTDDIVLDTNNVSGLPIYTGVSRGWVDGIKQ